MTEKPAAEEYVYHIGKIRFIVTPVYKETGELKDGALYPHPQETAGSDARLERHHLDGDD